VRCGAAVTFAGSALVLFADAGLALGLIFALMLFASSRAAGTHLAQGMALAAPDARATIGAPNAAPVPKRSAPQRAMLFRTSPSRSGSSRSSTSITPRTSIKVIYSQQPRKERIASDNGRSQAT